MRRRLARQPTKTCRWRNSLSVIIITIITAGVDMDRAWSWYRREGVGITITITIITTIIITASIGIEIAPTMMRKAGPTPRSCFFGLILARLFLGCAMQMAVGAVKHRVG